MAGNYCVCRDSTWAPKGFVPPYLLPQIVEEENDFAKALGHGSPIHVIEYYDPVTGGVILYPNGPPLGNKGTKQRDVLDRLRHNHLHDLDTPRQTATVASESHFQACQRNEGAQLSRANATRPIVFERQSPPVPSTTGHSFRLGAHLSRSLGQPRATRLDGALHDMDLPQPESETMNTDSFAAITPFSLTSPLNSQNSPSPRHIDEKFSIHYSDRNNICTTTRVFVTSGVHWFR